MVLLKDKNMENLLNINPTTEYKIRQESNCPEKNSCIGFSRAIQTENGILPCTTVYRCPFARIQMWQWDTPPRN